MGTKRKFGQCIRGPKEIFKDTKELTVVCFACQVQPGELQEDLSRVARVMFTPEYAVCLYVLLVVY